MGKHHDHSFKLETCSDKHGSRKYRGLPADSSERPPPYSREKVWVGGYKRRNGTEVRGHFRKGLKRHLF